MPTNKILSDADKTKSATAGVREDLRKNEDPNPLKNKAVIYNSDARLGYQDIKNKIDQGYTPIKLSEFKKQTNAYYSSLPNGAGQVMKDKLRLKQAGVDDLDKYESAIKTGNPGKLGKFDDRNIAEKMLNLNPNQGFVGDVFETLNRPLQALKNSIFNIGEGQGVGQKVANFFIGAEKGITGDADEHTWGEAMNHATGANLHISPMLNMVMDIGFDPLNIAPMIGNKIAGFNRAKEAKAFSKDKVAFEDITKQAIEGQDLLEDGHITVEDHNNAISSMVKEAKKKGASKKFLEQFEREFSFNKAEPLKAKNAREEVIGDADELAMTANPLMQELEDATEEDNTMSRKYIETRGNSYHDIPTQHFHSRIASLSNHSEGNDALHMFGRGIPNSSKKQVARAIGIKKTVKAEMAKLIKRNNELIEAKGLNRETLTPQVRKDMAVERRQIIADMKKHKETLTKVNTSLDRFSRTALGKDVYKTVDSINKAARTAKISKRGQDIVHIDISGDMSGFKLYTHNSNGMRKVMYKNEKRFNSLHERGSVRIPIHKDFVAKMSDLSDKQKRIVQKYDYVKAHKQAYVNKHSAVYEDRWDWNRYMQHSLTDEGKLLVSGGGTNYKILGNPGSHAEQATTYKYNEIAKMQSDKKEAVAKSLGYKSYKKLELKEMRKVNKKLNKMYEESANQPKLRSTLSSHPRRIFGTIDEANANYKAVGKFFKDDMTDLTHLDMTNMKRYVVPEAFLNTMAKNGAIRFSDDSKAINEVLVGRNAKGKQTYKARLSDRGIGENEKVFSLGSENGGLGFSDDVASHLAKTFGHDKIVMDDSSAYVLQRMNNVHKANQFNVLSSKYMSFWKGSKLMTAGFHMRKLAGESTAIYLSGLNPMKVMNHAAKVGSMKKAYNNVASMLAEGKSELEINPRLLDAHNEWKDFIRENEIGSNGGSAVAQFDDVLKMSDAAAKQGFFANKLNKMIKLNYKAVGSVDTMMRFGVWKEAKLNPNIVRRFAGEGASAGDMVKAVKFDYNNSTRSEDMIKKVIPFWTFAKNNTMLVAKTFLKNPNRINHVANLINNTMQNTGLDSTQLPDYVKNQGYLSMEGLRDMITGKKGSSGAGDDSFLKWGSIVNDALNPLESLTAVSPIISAGKTALGGDTNKYATNWDKVSQKYNYMRAVSGDMGINPQQAENQMGMFDNPMSKLGIAAPRTFSVLQELDPTPLQGWTKLLTGMGQDINNGEVGAHTFFPSVIKHIDPIEMKMTQLYFEKGMISQLKSAYQTVTGTYLPALGSIANPKQVVDKTDQWKDFYSNFIDEGDDHRTQADMNDILQAANQ